MQDGKGSNLDQYDTTPESRKKRPYICIHFKCCKLYQRIYLNRTRDAFIGWCPKCMNKAVVEVAEDGEETIFFTAS